MNQVLVYYQNKNNCDAIIWGNEDIYVGPDTDAYHTLVIEIKSCFLQYSCAEDANIFSSVKYANISSLNYILIDQFIASSVFYDYTSDQYVHMIITN